MPNPIPQATQKQRQWDAASPVGAAYFVDVAPTELEIILTKYSTTMAHLRCWVWTATPPHPKTKEPPRFLEAALVLAHGQHPDAVRAGHRPDATVPCPLFLGRRVGGLFGFRLGVFEFFFSPTAWAWSLSSPYCATTCFLPPSISVKTPGYCQGFLRNQ